MKTNVAVFFGGRSVEHEISVISASQAMHAINREKYNVIPVYISKQGKWYTGEKLFDIANYRDMNTLVKNCEEVFMRPEFGDYNLYRAKTKLFGSNIYAAIDVVIPALHGTNGEDGIFEGVLETIGIPYAGCNTVSSANGMDKITMKMILKECGIPVVDYVWFTDKQWYKQKDALIEKIESQIGYPVIVKPANLGSSVGISRATNRESLIESIETAEKYSARIIVEDMVENLKEINCSVLGDCDDYQTSTLEEPIKTGEFLSYEDKYMGGTKSAKGMQASQKRIPADLSKELTERIQFLAGETFRVLSCHGVSRVDFMVDDDTQNVYVNEINTIPGSLSFYLWEATGIPFDRLMDNLIQLALKRKREQSMKTTNFDQNIFSLSGGVKGGVKK
ncbi:MAG TPA: D-alanine--D-alanine ligase [Candidatus Limisoma intestinavium]|uniref:D-alanine--D-alanine ligase n=1 Tax=Candidatus Limisoma intestinavium TaxID=2840856 RepID=A0A9D1LHA5_9BACT|nr:D-alanine--D-alanine ligase [Candidatus Limisoma intestinavium]